MHPDIVVIGGSAGGLAALTELVSVLPRRLSAAVFVVLHVGRATPSALPAILKRASALPVGVPADGEPIRKGRIYVAPSNRHLVLEERAVRVTHGPQENGHRPAVDPLFRSAARSFGPRVAGVVLSGSRDDGTAGLIAIKLRGGVALVQDPKTAAHRGMPASALAHVQADHVLSPADLGRTVVALSREKNGKRRAPRTRLMDVESNAATLDEAPTTAPSLGTPSDQTCPDCHGTLFSVEEGGFSRYRCRVGHAYSPSSLMRAQVTGIEDALWAAYRALEENAALARHMTDRAATQKMPAAASQFHERERSARQNATRVLKLLELWTQAEDHTAEEGA